MSCMTLLGDVVKSWIRPSK